MRAALQVRFAIAAVSAALALAWAASAFAYTAPARLSETGLYRADGSIDPANRSFVPQYPLWTDGAVKSRWIRLPAGKTIDVSDIDAWRFPPGTTFWKEFAWEGHKVETRMIHVGDDGAWTFATYVWNEEQTDALLAPERGVVGAFALAGNKRHSIPSVEDCRTCHASAPAVVLGFNALQLSDDRDPLAPHAEPLKDGAITLRSLVADDLIRPRRADLAANPPRIQSADPAGRAALGYLSSNCGGCHNDRGPLARLGFSFLHRVADEAEGREAVLATAAGAPGRYEIPGAPAGSTRILTPGDPELSALVYRMRSRRPSSQMPPLGSAIVDDDAAKLLSQWIARMEQPVKMVQDR